MRKATIFAMALMAGITMAGNPMKVEAAPANSTVIKKVIVKDGSTLKECLEQLNCKNIGNSMVITIPCVPGMGEECPETETPDCNTPETETPNNGGTEKPETETPSGGETEKPDTNKPVTPDNNETETPETETPEEDNSQSDYHAYVLRVVELVNEERAKAGLNPLTLQKNITEAAQVRAIETVTSFSHTRPDGRHFTTALKESGVSYRGAGENIAWGQKTPEQVMNGWMNSAGHRANILNEKYTSIGVGYYQNGSGVNYWTQLFTD